MRRTNRLDDADDGVRMNLRGVIDAGLHTYFEEEIARTETLLDDNDQGGVLRALGGHDGVAMSKGGKRAVNHGRGRHAITR